MMCKLIRQKGEEENSPIPKPISRFMADDIRKATRVERQGNFQFVFFFSTGFYDVFSSLSLSLFCKACLLYLLEKPDFANFFLSRNGEEGMFFSLLLSVLSLDKFVHLPCFGVRGEGMHKIA